ncbi:ion transporter [Membranicola marinus]|uniref:Ion transporter n=1 Tax=Membranihabitans marinus TaxID=1227546 RepID=A0A953HKL0_9BACT|nr:ion transporter [Membranihabitans marinus]MBY5957397.1 ion transporter [Membranihabitans marinus]
MKPQIGEESPKFRKFRAKAHELIFEADTPQGKLFDVVLLILILISVGVVMLDSVPDYHKDYSEILWILELFFTFIFTIEYIVRLLSVRKPLVYATSFFGIVDLLSIIPTYLAFFFTGSQYLIVIRGLRLLRVFRILGLHNFVNDSLSIVNSLRRSSRKIVIFLLFVLMVVTILGTALYLLESDINEGFNSIPRSIYWAIVTVTTVGYGDISPITSTGQFLAAIAMILGYAVIAVPTGIVSTEFIRTGKRIQHTNISCPDCGAEGHYHSARYCFKCSAPLKDEIIES